jgi:predicted dehydrogenase
MKKNIPDNSRRKFIFTVGITAVGVPLLSSFGGLDLLSDKKKKLGVALVGLGKYATEELAPALVQTEDCYLAAIVTGTPSKIPYWKKKYNIADKNIYSYDNYDSIKDNPDIDIVYIVLPNSMHAEYSIRASEAGKHVICEKPMAMSVEECDAMIAASKKAGKSLSIGYRLHYDPYHLEMVKMGTQKKYGEIKKLKAAFAFQAPKKNWWRLDRKYAGGGPLMDLGIYCLQAVIYTTGMLPVAVTAQSPPVSDKEVFIDVEETLTWQMELPNGAIAECRTSYSGEYQNYLRAEAENGWFELNPAFSYGGITGSTSDGKKLKYPKLSQQAKQMDGIAVSIKNNQESIVPGEMGRRDMKIIEAIYKAINTGERIAIEW